MSAVSDGGGGVGNQFEYLGRSGGERGVTSVELDGFTGVDTLSHLTIASFGTSVLTSQGLRYGMNLRTLLTIEALDLVWKDVQKP